MQPSDEGVNASGLTLPRREVPPAPKGPEVFLCPEAAMLTRECAGCVNRRRAGSALPGLPDNQKRRCVNRKPRLGPLRKFRGSVVVIP